MRLDVLQVGSCIGDTHSNALMWDINKIEKTSNCIFIEPIPNLYKRLVYNYNRLIPDNKFIFINKAISNKNGFVNMYMLNNIEDCINSNRRYGKAPSWAKGISSINKKHIEAHAKYNSAGYISDPEINKITVKCVTLNSIINKYNIKNIDVLQIDAEGHDYDILMDFNLNNIKPQIIIFEKSHIDGTFNSDLVTTRHDSLIEYLTENSYKFDKKNRENLRMVLNK